VYYYFDREQLYQHTRIGNLHPILGRQNQQAMIVTDWRKGGVRLLPEHGYSQPGTQFPGKRHNLLRRQPNLAEVENLAAVEISGHIIFQPRPGNELQYIARRIFKILRVGIPKP